MQDEANDINKDQDKTPMDDDKASNEAKSAPNNPKKSIAAFIMPDSMADIFGEDFKPDEIAMTR